jgi:hypothetical protein
MRRHFWYYVCVRSNVNIQITDRQNVDKMSTNVDFICPLLTTYGLGALSRTTYGLVKMDPTDLACRDVLLDVVEADHGVRIGSVVTGGVAAGGGDGVGAGVNFANQFRP